MIYSSSSSASILLIAFTITTLTFVKVQLGEVVVVVFCTAKESSSSSSRFGIKNINNNDNIINDIDDKNVNDDSVAIGNRIVGKTTTTNNNFNNNKSPNFLFLLVDDIGYGDFSYHVGSGSGPGGGSGSIAKTPNIDRWVQSPGTVKFHDFHSSGTVCSPTRATVLTGRNHFRDCVDFVYGCPDQRRCPNLQWEFAPSQTFTVADAVQLASSSSRRQRQRQLQQQERRNTSTTSVNNKDIEDNSYTSFFTGKWHLGAFYNESTSSSTSTTTRGKKRGTKSSMLLGRVRGPVTSSPTTHGFCHFNATIECGRTMTMNCLCKPDWHKHCLYGHYDGPSSSWCPVNDDDDDDDDAEAAELCCSNYWWDDPYSPHGVSNMTWQTPDDDASYLVDSFERFLVSTGPGYEEEGLQNNDDGEDDDILGATTTTTTSSSSSSLPTHGHQRPWLAQISFHNCHIPFVGSDRIKKECSSDNSTVCRPPLAGQPPYTDEELDYYACLIQLDVAVGQILDLLHQRNEYDNTMIWLTSDNGPEGNCPPLGFCKYYGDDDDDVDGGGDKFRPRDAGPGSTGGLRGRKRDIYEGGHRVPGIVSYPAVVVGTANNDNDNADAKKETDGFESWQTVYTTDFLPTVMDVLGVDRPESQQDWSFDGRSILPLLKDPSKFRWNETSVGVRSAGIGYHDIELSNVNGWGYRHGRWKYVHGSKSCTDPNDVCYRPQLYDLETDLEERHDLSTKHPDILKMLQETFRQWHTSVVKSRREESMCTEVTDIDLTLPSTLVQ